MDTYDYKGNNLLYKKKNFMNFPQDIDMDTPVYRLYPINRLLELLFTKKDTLVKPALWDDPFENFLFKQVAIGQNGREVHFDSIRESLYGQCWTLNNKETDALWRIYSPNKDGIRVKTTLRKLWNNFYNEDNTSAMVEYYIGKIKYAETQEIKNTFENSNIWSEIFSHSGRGVVGTILIKRTEFEHENEIRLIFMDNNNTLGSSNLYKYSFEPNEIIDELLFDPRFDDNMYRIINEKLSDIGFKANVQKSELYSIPKLNLRLNI